jgi:hypothetical protein
MIATISNNIASTTLSSNTANIASNSTNIASFPALPPGEEIYDLMDTLSMSFPWFDSIKEIVLIVIGVIIISYFYKWLISPVIKKRVPIDQSPETHAIRAIKRLKLSDVWKNRDIKTICEKVASILKNYALEAYKIGIGDAATTDEFIIDIINCKIKNSILSEIKNILNYCDDVRYTGGNVDNIKPEDLIQTLENLIHTEGWIK